MLDVALLHSVLNQKLPAALRLLEQMVGINSFTTNRAGVDQLAKLTAESFSSLGFEARNIPSRFPDYAAHLVLTRRGHSNMNIAMISHLDTVFPPEEEAQNGFHWRIDGDRIYGPGTNDIKGGTVMTWLVLEGLKAAAPDLFNEITWRLIWNSSEECFSPDFGDVCRQQFDSDTLAALIFESEGRLGEEPLLVVARKGRITWRVKVLGRGAHAGSSHRQGANAVVQLGRMLERISALTDYSRDLTVNVGRVTGGTVLNRVPHEAIAEGEMRAFAPELLEAAKTALLAMQGEGEVKARSDGFPCRVRVEFPGDSRPWPRNPESDRLFSFWEQAAVELAQPIGHEERGGLSDGNLIWDAVPTIDGLGPWGDNSHCSEWSKDGSKTPEYVLQSSFIPKALLNALAISKLAESTHQ